MLQCLLPTLLTTSATVDSSKSVDIHSIDNYSSTPRPYTPHELESLEIEASVPLLDVGIVDDTTDVRKDWASGVLLEAELVRLCLLLLSSSY